MFCSYACGSPEHTLPRRRFLTGVAGSLGAFGLGQMVQPAAARELEKAQKRVLVVFLAGGVSQLETWDPKPGTDTGGPFQAIPTSVPGTHVCELLPHTARLMHHLALLRGVNTAEDDHAKGAYIMHTGRRQDPATKYPPRARPGPRSPRPSARPAPSCSAPGTARCPATCTSARAATAPRPRTLASSARTSPPWPSTTAGRRTTSSGRRPCRPRPTASAR